MAEYIPSKLTAGTTIDLIVTLTAYQAPEWTVQLVLRGPGQIDLAAAPDGTAHRLTVAAADSAQWLAGQYAYSLRATNGDAVIEVDAGTTTVVGDLAAIDGVHDSHGHVERVLAAIEATIEQRATKDQERYRINNRELWRTPIGELFKLRDHYRAELRRLKASRRGNDLLGRRVLVRL